MASGFSIDPKGFLRVRQSGELSLDAVEAVRRNSLPLLLEHGISKVLVDYRDADLAAVGLIELDDLSLSLKEQVPPCKKMAMIFSPGPQDTLFTHLINVCKLQGIEARLFIAEASAEHWLLSS